MTDETEPEPLDISSDEYRYEACSITNEECCGISCRTCETAVCEHRSEHDEEIKSICTFKDRTQNGIKAEVNGYNTVLRCGSVEDARVYVDLSRWEDYTETKGLIDQEIIDKEYPHLNVLMKILDMKPCTESYYLQGWPLITVHGDVVLAMAPRIEPNTTG